MLQLQCWPLQQQDADHTLNKEPCRLKLFYNSTNVAVNDPSTFGIEAGTLPVEGSEVPPYTEAVLNRTEYGEQDGKRTQFVSWPLLYFHGGPGCNLLLDKPVIHRVNLPYKPRRATQVCARSSCRSHMFVQALLLCAPTGMYHMGWASSCAPG